MEPTNPKALGFTESLRPLFEPRRVAIVFILAGMALQTARWAENRSLWQDEAAVGLNIRDRSFAELAKPLDSNQAAPIGFLWVEKLAIVILGDNECALRIFPLIAAWAALWLANEWFRGAIKPWEGVLAVGLLAFQPRLIEFAAELKPYSVDVAAALVVLVLDLRVRRAGFRGGWLAASILSGVLLPWFSFPVIFVLAATALSAAVTLANSGRWRLLLGLSAAWAFWAASWGLQMALLRPIGANEYLNLWWAEQFMPYDHGVWGALSWLVTSWIDLFRATMRTSPAWFAGLGAAAGLFLIVRQRRGASWTILGVLIAAFAAAAWHRYPLGDRLALYLLPILAAGLATALASIARIRIRFFRLATGLLAIGLLGATAGDAGLDFFRQGHSEESRPILRRLAANESPENRVYIYCHSRLAFDYYAKRFGLRMKPVFGNGIVPSDDPQLRDLLTQRRVWLFFAHGWKLGRTAPARNIQADFLKYADALARRIDSVEARGSAAFLYEPVSTARRLTGERASRFVSGSSQFEPDPRGPLQPPATAGVNALALEKAHEIGP